MIPLLLSRPVERNVFGVGLHRGEPVWSEILDPAALPRGWPHLPEPALTDGDQLLSGVDPAAFVGRLAIAEHAGEEWRSKRQADFGSDGGGLRKLVQDVGDGLRAGDGVHRLRKMSPLPVGDGGDLLFRDAAQDFGVVNHAADESSADRQGQGSELAAGHDVGVEVGELAGTWDLVGQLGADDLGLQRNGRQHLAGSVSQLEVEILKCLVGCIRRQNPGHQHLVDEAAGAVFPADERDMRELVVRALL